MNMLFFLKMLGDCSFFLAIAAFFASYFGQEESLVPFSVLLAACCAAGRYIREKRGKTGLYNLLPLAVFIAACVICILRGHLAPAGALCLAAPFLYGLASLLTGRTEIEAPDVREQFSLLVKILPFMLFIGLISMDFARLSRYSVPSAILFLASYVLVMRMSRHDRSVIEEKRFQAMNFAAAALVCLLAVLLSSKVFLSAVSAVIKAVYSLLVTPLILLIMILASVFFWLFSHLVPQGASQQVESTFKMSEEATQEVLQELGVQTGNGHPYLAALFTVLLAAGAVLCIALLFRRLAGSRRLGEIRRPGENRTFLASSDGQKETLPRFSRDPSVRVRRRWQQVLRLAGRSGAHLASSMSTLQQAEEVNRVLRGSGEELEKLRTLYLKARYGLQADAESATEATRLYRAIKDRSQSV